MLLILSIAGAAALTVLAYARLRSRSPEAASAATRAVRELAAVVLVLARATEQVVDALQAGHRTRLSYAAGPSWGDNDPYGLEEES